uniref:Uncharacterized protein n=1 Tax=Tanacetum cinerariifolium TaxID=118510 RepID=A0A6L2N4Q1_TANCI|nr:hypothetical protein [Tanacetum cinerariifolium]
MPILPPGMIPVTKPEPLKIVKTRQIAQFNADRDPGVYIQMKSSATREYPSLIHTFIVTHCWREEMLRLQALGSNTSSGVPYTKEEINTLARKGKQRGHLPGVGRMLNQYESSPEFGNASESGGCGDDEMVDDEDGGEDEEDEDDGDTLSRATCRPGKSSTVELISLTEIKWAPPSIPGELSPSIYPQRQVAWEGVDLSPGIVVNVVVFCDDFGITVRGWKKK